MIENLAESPAEIKKSPADFSRPQDKTSLNVLMITEALDADSCHLGFVKNWVEVLARSLHRMIVATCFSHDFKTNENVKVYAAQRQRIYAARGTATLTRILQMASLFFCVTRCLLFEKVDIVLAHMNPIFVMMAAPVAKLRRIPMILWYARGNVSDKLRLANFLCARVVTASEQSCKIQSPKRIIIGHGIDTEMFAPAIPDAGRRPSKVVLSVSRIAPIKRCDLILSAFAFLKDKPWFPSSRLVFAGDIVYPTDAPYLEGLKEQARRLGVERNVEFKGKIRYEEIADVYRACDLFVNATSPGSVDKAVLEAMSCGKPIVTTNTAFETILGPHSRTMFVPGEDIADFAAKLAFYLEMDEASRRIAGLELRGMVVAQHSLEGLGKKLVSLMETLSAGK